MSPYGSTLVGDAGAASGVVFGICTLGGGVASGGTALVKIFSSFLSANVFLSPSVVSGLVGVGLRRSWFRFAAACVAEYCEEILGKVSVAENKS